MALGEIKILRFIDGVVVDSSQVVSLGSLVKTKMANYSILTEDRVILGDTTSGSVTITLPDATQVLYAIFDIKKIAAANELVVNTAGGNIDGVASVILKENMQTASFVSDGTSWWIIEDTIPKSAVYFGGNENMNGSFRALVDLGELKFQKRIAGVWTTLGSFAE